MSATLKLVRQSVLLELRRGTFDVRVDERSVGSVEPRQTSEVPIESGRHTVEVRSGRYSSQPRSFEVADDELVAFRCSGARIWPIYLASLVKPDLALTLKRM